MKINIYNQENGLHNPYNQNINSSKYRIAEFIIDCVRKAEVMFAVTPTEIFSKKRSSPIAEVRGVLMLSCYRLLKNKSSHVSTAMVAAVFHRDHASLCNYIRKETTRDHHFFRYYTPLYSEILFVFEKHFPHGEKFDDLGVYQVQDLIDLAFFLGHTDRDVERFLKTRAQ